MFIYALTGFVDVQPYVISEFWGTDPEVIYLWPKFYIPLCVGLPILWFLVRLCWRPFTDERFEDETEEEMQEAIYRDTTTRMKTVRNDLSGIKMDQEMEEIEASRGLSSDDDYDDGLGNSTPQKEKFPEEQQDLEPGSLDFNHHKMEQLQRRMTKVMDAAKRIQQEINELRANMAMGNSDVTSVVPDGRGKKDPDDPIDDSDGKTKGKEDSRLT